MPESDLNITTSPAEAFDLRQDAKFFADIFLVGWLTIKLIRTQAEVNRGGGENWMKHRHRQPWQTCVLLAAVLLAPGTGLGEPDGDLPGAGTAPPVTDAASFAQELHTSGALQFYGHTEDLLRTGQFDRALLRYAFLKAQIGGQPGYRPLVRLIDQRLHFLKGQLKLPAGEMAALKAPRVRQSRPGKAQTAHDAHLDSPPANQQSGANTGQDPARESPRLAATDQAPPRQEEAGAPLQAAKPQEKPEEVQVEEEKPPAPPPSRWQRLKRRLLFWRK